MPAPSQAIDIEPARYKYSAGKESLATVLSAKNVLKLHKFFN